MKFARGSGKSPSRKIRVKSLDAGGLKLQVQNSESEGDRVLKRTFRDKPGGKSGLSAVYNSKAGHSDLEETQSSR